MTTNDPSSHDIFPGARRVEAVETHYVVKDADGRVYLRNVDESDLRRNGQAEADMADKTLYAYRTNESTACRTFAPRVPVKERVLRSTLVQELDGLQPDMVRFPGYLSRRAQTALAEARIALGIPRHSEARGVEVIALAQKNAAATEASELRIVDEIVSELIEEEASK